MRHGKSDWSTKTARDYDRPLAERGIEAAKLMGEHLKAVEQTPQLILNSGAKRAQDTADLAVSAGDWSCEQEASRHLYMASVSEVIEMIEQVSEDVDQLMIVGHEPVCSNLISELAMGAYVKFPTASVARLTIKVKKWSDIQDKAARLDWLLSPKILKNT